MDQKGPQKSSLSPADGIWGRGENQGPQGCRWERKQWGGPCFRYHQAHLANTFSRPPGRATGNSGGGRGTRGGGEGRMGDRVESPGRWCWWGLASIGLARPARFWRGLGMRALAREPWRKSQWVGLSRWKQAFILFFFYFWKKKFIWLWWVLVVACRIFNVCCGMRTFFKITVCGI